MHNIKAPQPPKCVDPRHRLNLRQHPIITINQLVVTGSCIGTTYCNRLYSIEIPISLERSLPSHPTSYQRISQCFDFLGPGLTYASYSSQVLPCVHWVIRAPDTVAPYACIPSLAFPWDSERARVGDVRTVRLVHRSATQRKEVYISLP